MAQAGSLMALRKRNKWQQLLSAGVVTAGDIIQIGVYRDPTRAPQPMIQSHVTIHSVTIVDDGICVVGKNQYQRPGQCFTALFPKLSKKHSWMDCCFLRGLSLRELIVNNLVCSFCL